MEKEYIYIDKRIADKLNQLGSVEEQEKIVLSIIEQKRLDLSKENEFLDENLLIFKSVCLKHKVELQKIYDAENEKLYAMWEEMGDIASAVSKHAKEVSGQIRPISEAVKNLACSVRALKDDIEKTNIYIPEKLAALASSVASMDETTKQLLRDLLNNKKGE